MKRAIFRIALRPGSPPLLALAQDGSSSDPPHRWARASSNVCAPSGPRSKTPGTATLATGPTLQTSDRHPIDCFVFPYLPNRLLRLGLRPRKHHKTRHLAATIQNPYKPPNHTQNHYKTDYIATPIRKSLHETTELVLFKTPPLASWPLV